MKHFFYFVLILIYPFPCISQTSLNAADISVMTSSDYTPQGWNESASGIKTINGNGFEGKLDEASRFLLQAAFGGNLQMIKEVAETGIEPWIDYQMSLPPHLMLPVVDSIFVTTDPQHGKGSEIGKHKQGIVEEYPRITFRCIERNRCHHKTCMGD